VVFATLNFILGLCFFGQNNSPHDYPKRMGLLVM